MNIKHFFILLAIASLACGASREVVNTEPQENQQPTPSTSSNQETQPTSVSQPTVLQADVVDINWYTDSINTLHFVGTIKNSGTVDLSLTEIIVNLRDDAGTLIGTASAYSSLDIVKIGETSPFHVIFLESPTNWTQHEVIVQGSENSFLTSYRDFEVISPQGKLADFGGYEIVGEVKNVGSKDAEFVKVIVILYDSSGKILGVDFTFATLDKVVAGGTSPFQVLVFSTAEGSIDHFDLIVEGQASN